ncbi:F0F1 ATP synthase subunit delta [Nocardioides sp. MAH-18]|uniref:ATP synthase subunit delta n=1 Tax=Nocardioides agri TaxID=2682843 RepID=A0A6L6XLI4_9ACTN|nr:MULTISPECIES: F0F1 ATP synthase subunit delta [unclassified Nocardioides]MBA2956608.1 F0F1 ATP synthase subunit delta [Nocardioides sp. CGMCC 1.13656]MVQ47752.1 F0F1 ATP synthase subunit delta [Nocardioides sp. MAH-18]
MVQPLSSLRGSSAEALQVLGERVDNDGFTLEQFAELGLDLFGLAALLRSEPTLRRTLTDVSTPAQAKAALVHGLLDGKASAGAVDVLAEASGLRWLAARDLADALEHLGVVAIVRSAGRREAARLSDELFVVGQVVNDSPELRIALSDPARSRADKGELLRRLLEGRALPATVTLTEQALAGSFRSVEAAIKEFQKVAAATQGEGVALVRTARELSDAQRTRLADALSAQYGRPVHLNVEVEPALLGGLRIEIGDDVIDGTVVARLDNARRKLAG